ncbi:MAG TPA: Stp1/IreP family PP2C-type Ser/Thr phosphatase [Thermoflexia bacterium]|nr:Stp1/IreP family PP2C-type Ser/Thr phosphatase [Thermoflexia bacterium]
MLTKTGQAFAGREEEVLREQIIAGNCVLFIGPDVGSDTLRVLPGRARLARQLAACQGWDFQDDWSFPWIAQCHELQFGRSSLISFLKEKIGRMKEPPACYRAIAALPFRLILTTNYDTLLEKALEEQGVAYQKILGTYDLKHGMLDRVRIVKLYGCITEPDSMVITEEDLFAFLDRWPSILSILEGGFSGKTLLFIGCNLAHRDFRHMYHYLAPMFSKDTRSAYFIQAGIADSLARYWATKGLTVVRAEAGELLRKAAEHIAVREGEEKRPRERASDLLALEVSHLTQTGREHRVNQDCLRVCMPSDPQQRQRGNLFLVADGMGGRKAGAIASHLAADVIVERYYTDTKEDVSAGLIRAIEAANRAIHQQAEENPAQSNMGTTVVVAVIRGQELHVANVGDSRAYLIHDGEIGQITLDHSWVAEEVRAGRMTPEEAREHPQRNLLTRGLGLDAQVEVDTFRRNLESGDIIVLCSDGLTEYVEDDEIREVVTSEHSSAALAVKRLVQMASDRGGADDISVIVVKVS